MKNNNKTRKCVYDIFSEFEFINKDGTLTAKFFHAIARPIAEELFSELEEKYCDEMGVSVVGDTINVLLDNGFIDSAVCLFEYLYDKAELPMPKKIKQFCEDEDYVNMILRAVSNSLIEVAELNC